MSKGDDHMRTKYAKVPLKDKLCFLQKVKEEHLSIKESAAMFGINYSTAKTLIRQYRFNLFPYELPNQKKVSPLKPRREQVSWIRCEYRDVEVSTMKIEASETDEPYFYLQGQSEQKRETDEEAQDLPVLHSQPIQLNKIEVISSTLFE